MADNETRRRADADSDYGSALIPLENRLKLDSNVLSILQALAAATKSASTFKTLNLTSTSRQVTNLTPSSLQTQIQELASSIVKSVLDGKSSSFKAAARNQHHVPELVRIFLKPKTSRHPLASVSTARKVAMAASVLSLIPQIRTRDRTCYMSDLLYTNLKLFQDETKFGAVFDEVAGMLGHTRRSLNIFDGLKGRVQGRFFFTEGGHMIDCTNMGIGEVIIPRKIDTVGDMSTDASFILLVEDEDVSMYLAQDKYYNRCIIVTTEGEPDIPTRLFLRKMKMDLKLPILAVINCDPSSLKMLAVDDGYYDASLTTLDIKWVGLRPSDLDKYQLPQCCREPMTEKDIKICKDLLEGDFVKKNPGWVEELNIMLKLKQKAEALSLVSLGSQYISKFYLPLKLEEQDWV